ncbi:unnamed protein product [Cylindrotheca closterium]|uniref:Uncharacterized protein n=1 Tax=Cylindrotheca closterium TaxID=2856 RepID=A0AAD2GA37_9STRA|nr:unnamed protein product [Cylindrotheca closterium]
MTSCPLVRNQFIRLEAALSMHTIPIFSSAALPQPWDEKSEATTPNKRYNHRATPNQHTTTSMTATVSALNANQTAIPTSPMHQSLPVKRHCSESVWNTRQAQDHQQLMMAFQRNQKEHDGAHSFQSAARKRAYQGDLQQTSFQQMEYTSSSVERIVKKSRLEASSSSLDTMRCDDDEAVSETMLTQGESPSSPSMQDAEEVWNFIGIG